MVPALVLLGLGLGAVVVGAAASRKPPRRRGPKKATEPKWRRAEREACARRGLTHRGGPGQADCGIGVEVKDHARPVGVAILRAEWRKGRREVVSASGFTTPARSFAKRVGLRLRRS